jgi:endoglycosylceramidase
MVAASRARVHLAVGLGGMLALLIAVGGLPATAAEDSPRLQREGRWLIDNDGRVVLTHGVNLVWKNDPYVPPDEPAGFTAADADWLVDHGFSSARVGTLWVGVSPDAPGQIDTAYLDAWDRVVDLLAERRIYSLFDFHQDMLIHEFQGEGVPEWAVEPGPSTTVLGPPMFGFPFNYFTPQVSEAFDNLWAAGPGSDAWDGYRDAWIAVADRWADQPYTMGYDLLNEPWAGLEWPTCIFVPQTGCPGTDRDEIQPFFEHAIAGIRTVDPDNLVWMEPQLLAGGTGSPTGFGPIEGEDQLGYSIHNYCPLTALLQSAELGLPVPTGQLPDTCEDFERSVFEQSRITSERIGAVELVTEFGATDDVELLTRVTSLADEHLVGWQYWAYKEWNDPTTQSQGSGAQGLFTDDADLSTAKRDKLMVLVRTYPMTTAGVPESVSFDPTTGAFEYAYTAGDQAAPTEIFISPLHYDGCYEATVTGGTITSMDQAQVLTVEADAGSDVTVSVAAGSGCAPAAGPGGADDPSGQPAAPTTPVTGGGAALAAMATLSLALLSGRSRTRRGSRRTQYGRRPR